MPDIQQQGDGSDPRKDRGEEFRQRISIALDWLLIVKAVWTTEQLLMLTLDGSAAPTAAVTAAGAALGVTEVVLRACNRKRH